jgi:hypothetical protein
MSITLLPDPVLSVDNNLLVALVKAVSCHGFCHVWSQIHCRASQLTIPTLFTMCVGATIIHNVHNFSS